MSGKDVNPPSPTADHPTVIEWARGFDAVPPDSFDQAVTALRARYGHRYAIRRIGRLWVATDVDPLTETAPTIIEDTLTRFVTELESPGLRAGGPFGRPTE